MEVFWIKLLDSFCVKFHLINQVSSADSVLAPQTNLYDTFIHLSISVLFVPHFVPSSLSDAGVTERDLLMSSRS